MTTPSNLATQVKEIFSGIYEGSMKGLPIVNPMIDVEAFGFEEFEGRTVGIIITPWLMSLALFPGEGDDWENIQIGEKKYFTFPARDYEFMANEIEGMGKYYSFALYSPMHEFEHHDHAVAGANAFMELLMVENENAEEELDERRLAMFLQGEDMETIKQKECAAKNPKTDGEMTFKDGQVEPIDRRQLLRGHFTGSHTPA